MAKYFGGGHLRYWYGQWLDDNGDPVDAVEVVRCKDCRFGKLDTAHRMKTIDGQYDEVGFYECCRGWLANEYHRGEHFCSYGARKLEAQQDCTYNHKGHCTAQKLMPECDPKSCDRRNSHAVP